MPTPRQLSAVGVARDKIIVAGARLTFYGQDLHANEIYDPLADTWRAAEPMPTARGGAAAAVVGDRMYVIGGGNAHGTFPNNEIYDIDSDAWRTGRPMTVGRVNLAVVAIGRRIYAIGGGTKRTWSYSSTNEIYQT